MRLGSCLLWVAAASVVLVAPSISEPKENSARDELSLFFSEGKYGFCNSAGDTILPAIYDHAGPFSEGLAYIEQERKKCFIDTSGTVQIDFDDLTRRVALREFQPGGHDAGGEFLGIELRASDAAAFHDGFCVITFGPPGVEDMAMTFRVANQRQGFIDRGGRLLGDKIFFQASSFAEGLAAVEQLVSGRGQPGIAVGRWGFIDTTGQFVVPPKFQEARSFSEGLAAVEQEGSWGFIDTTGQFVIKPHFVDIHWTSGFINGRATVKISKEGEWSKIDRQGKVIEEER